MPDKPSYQNLENRGEQLQKEALEQKRIQEALRMSERKFWQLYDNLRIGFAAVGMDGTITEHNPAFLEMLGYAPGEISRLSYRDITPERWHAAEEKIIQEQVLKRGYSDSYEKEYRRKDGTVFPVELRTYLFKDKAGNPSGMWAFVTDISKRKQAMEALRESEEKYRKLYEQAKIAEALYRSLLHTSADAIVIYDMEGRASYINPSFTGVFGWTMDEVEGRRIPFLPESEREVTMAGIKQILAEGKGIQGFETKRYTKDGRLVDVNISGSRYVDHEGKPAGMLVVLRDISQRKMLEAQLRQAQRLEAVGSIASGIAHNFRNILSVISMKIQLLQMKFDNHSEMMGMLDGVDTYVDRGARLVEGLMQFCRQESKKEFQPVDLCDVLKEIHELVSKSFDKMINIRVLLPDSLPINGDLTELSQVFMNLCNNAKDAMPRGGDIVMTARREGDRALVLFSDTGEGMDKETQGKCFDPFFTTKDPDKGTGLGLSTTYGIVKEHGGEISVSSEPRKGTTFKLYFPLAPAMKEPEKEPSNETVQGKGQKILIVDDEMEFSKAMEEFLKDCGYQAESADNGKAALAKYKSWKPDVVFVDRNMPEMDGVTFTEKAIEYDSKAKIVMISGYDEYGPSGMEEKTRKLTMGYLTKPVNMSHITALLGRLL
ncbi:MAG: PAS domain S-box protein [Desulfobacterales bacterium]|nr:PAS domain S-box protein [Desulfobacterales bacterium]